MPKPVQKEGKISFVNKRYYITVDRARQEIQTGALVSAADLRKMVGKKVPVTVFGRSVVSIGKRPWIICYVPAPDLIRKINPKYQKFLRQQFEDLGVIPGVQ
jgi:hypothetical protein